MLYSFKDMLVDHELGRSDMLSYFRYLSGKCIYGCSCLAMMSKIVLKYLIYLSILSIFRSSDKL